MARPAKKFTPAEAQEIQRFLRSKVMAPDFYSDLVIPADCLSSNSKSARVDDAQARFDVIERAAVDDQPALLKAWLDEYLKPAAWTRAKAALRQRKVSTGTGSRDTLVLMSDGASVHFDILAAEAGLTKKDFAKEIGQFLMYSAAGRQAFQHFRDHCAIAAHKREKEARSALPNAFVVKSGKVRPAKNKA